jgi:hypothetical protein
LLIAASLIAAVRTAKEDNIMPTSPRIIARVQDSIRLAGWCGSLSRRTGSAHSAALIGCSKRKDDDSNGWPKMELKRIERGG